jgi:hypothetical protein
MIEKFAFFRVTRDLPNPKRDKRTVRGFYALETIKAGTLVRMRPANGKYSAPSMDILRPGRTSGMGVPYDAIEHFLPSGGFVESTTPNGAAEILFSLEINGESFDSVLVKLFDSGAVNAQNLRDAVDSLHADWSKEENEKLG